MSSNGLFFIKSILILESAKMDKTTLAKNKPNYVSPSLSILDKDENFYWYTNNRILPEHHDYTNTAKTLFNAQIYGFP